MNLETLLGMAFLENHPRLEIIKGIADIAAVLPDTDMQNAILNIAEQIYLPSHQKYLPQSQDSIFLALLQFCENVAAQNYPNMPSREFRAARADMEQLMTVLEQAWRKNHVSSAKLAADRALDWLGEALIGKILGTAEIADMRGYYMRRRHLRSG